MRTLAHIREFIDAITAWSAAQSDILAVALVGSYARNLASEASDIDLVLLVKDPSLYLADTAWASRFGSIASQSIEDWGMVTSLRVFYAPEPEVEYGFTTAAWAAQPLDDGTRRVIQDGMLVLYERVPLLSPLIDLTTMGGSMHGYGRAAVDAVRLYRKGGFEDPRSAWEEATTRIFGRNTASQRKGCPRGAFLGLCEEGLVAGIPDGDYTDSVKNKNYALRAVMLLYEFPELAMDAERLWEKVMRGIPKTPNNQMDVVIELWNHKMIQIP